MAIHEFDVSGLERDFLQVIFEKGQVLMEHLNWFEWQRKSFFSSPQFPASLAVTNQNNIKLSELCQNFYDLGLDFLFDSA